ncbi:spore coat U domain-containing protein [Acinetobacter nosocomialis]|uniref:Csu type fimbrial protein n=1 Tax=Acinetobacter nosocomialis TaxID=106654 RepID=UPI00111FDF96|nr:spore coat U domain-containing protein [Acinetobacter nosocomialis]MDC9814721.1 spore coat U domain-containing protein [Acinetobacter nosocomialis]MDE1704998.1 spore coat U domain-containing protein [Acinetobacter nosocomialis]MDE9403941.1 spore coat U domain-containing protein [Acinetobacter nosocomialis]HDG7213513.1 spore coat protein U domain-containing protein [Acinetobacter nosocomialis]HDG9762284.1 spore coat protein U domain-containing protein [Acinetobacter nosocomialis]
MSISIVSHSSYMLAKKISSALKYVLASLLLFVLYAFFSSAHAACTVTGTTNSTYTYTAANINSDATINFSGTISCLGGKTTPEISPYMCMKTVFTGATTANSSVTLPYTVTATVGGAGSSTTTQTSNVWYGPVKTVATNNIVSYSVNIKVPARSGTLVAYPKGTYIGTVQLYWDMQASSSTVCEGDSGGGWDSGNTTITANYVVPSFCQLDSTSNVDFGNISDIGTTSRDYTAQGAINATCNNGTPYSIYLGDGNNRISGGFRRMTNGSSQYIPYQLYKDTAYSTVWDTTGGITAVGGSGGVSKTGSGTSQISNVYGKIPQGTAISSTPGNYSDSIVVTVTY